MFTYMENKLKIVIVSNVFSHHQQPISDALYELLQDRFAFVETLGLTQELKNLGYEDDVCPPYLYKSYRDQADICHDLILNADAVVFGGAPESMIRERIKEQKLVFRCSERPLKRGLEPLKYIPRLIKWHRRNPEGKPIHLLCASGYAAADYAKFGLFQNKSYKWGYFPPTRRYEDVNALMERKEKNRILWCGRFLDLKHPDDALRVARMLKEEGIVFSLDFVGTGPMEGELRRLCTEWQLEDRVCFRGPMSPDGVRDEMERSGIALMTSDQQEGWGAVLNEAMNSACAVISSRESGSAPFLIRDGENGFVFSSGDIDTLVRLLKDLLLDPKNQRQLGERAYDTIITEWNAEIAAKRFLHLTESILNGTESPDIYTSGPCSKA